MFTQLFRNMFGWFFEKNETYRFRGPGSNGNWSSTKDGLSNGYWGCTDNLLSYLHWSGTKELLRLGVSNWLSNGLHLEICFLNFTSGNLNLNNGPLWIILKCKKTYANSRGGIRRISNGGWSKSSGSGSEKSEEEGCLVHDFYYFLTAKQFLQCLEYAYKLRWKRSLLLWS